MTGLLEPELTDQEFAHAEPDQPDCKPNGQHAGFGPPETEIVGDLAHTLWMLNQRVDANGGLSFDLSQQAATRSSMQAELDMYKDDDTNGIIKPQKVLWVVRQVMGREVVVAITNGRLDFGPWEQIFYGEFDGGRRKRVLVKIIGE